ncbi:MAG: Hsp20/alpha crystallin family protein [Candidatus Dormibacteria bacterium]
MNLVRWNPAFDLLGVHSEMDRVFNDLLKGSGFSPRYDGGANAPVYLPVDIRREGDSLVIDASVPGFTPEEVNVTVDAEVLTIAASHENQADQAERQYLRRERHLGQFYRQIALGDQVDGERAEAAFKDGVLTVTVPMVVKPEPRRIPIKGTESTGTPRVNTVQAQG